jgi:hypothetical protein
LQVVRDDNDGQLRFQLEQQLLDFLRRDRVERGAGLVEQQDLRFVGERSSDAESLLLARSDSARPGAGGPSLRPRARRA